jgi:hypothetical protein
MRLRPTAALLIGALCLAQTARPQDTSAPGNDYTGMYSFLRKGEFVQLNVERGSSRVTGFVARQSDGEKEVFIDHFFEKADLRDQGIRFSTREVHGIRFEFRGAISRGAAKTRNAEGYYQIKGTLIQYTSGANQKVTTKERAVTLVSLPQETCD